MRLRIRTLAILGAFVLVSLTMAPPTTADPGSWDLRGNANTSPGFHFLGTTDDKALVVKVNDRRALRIDPTSGTPNLISGASINRVAPGVEGATISGGGGAPIGFDQPNRVTNDFGTVGGGIANRATGFEATVGGGNSNRATDFGATVGGGNGNRAGFLATVGGGNFNRATGTGATVGGGGVNRATDHMATVGGGNFNSATGSGATVGGGDRNHATAFVATVGGGMLNRATGDDATVGGGLENRATDFGATVGGGNSNRATAIAATVAGGNGNRATGREATVGGGDENRATRRAATVGGGFGNDATLRGATVGGGIQNGATGRIATVAGGFRNGATGQFATVGGGFRNHASGDFSLASGRRAIADAEGAFVWADAVHPPFLATTFPCGGPSCGRNTFNVRATGGARFVSGINPTAEVVLQSGSGSWSSLSDRQAKAAVRPVDTRAVLRALAGLPISTFRYRTQDPGVRHMGPMAQDFHRAFGLGESSRYIASVDADGVALAAIKGLHAKVRAQGHTISSLKDEVGLLKSVLRAQGEQITALQRQVRRLAAG